MGLVFLKIFCPMRFPSFPHLRSPAKCQHLRCGKYTVTPGGERLGSGPGSGLARGAACAGTAGAPPGLRDPERARTGPASGARAGAICFRLNGNISDLTSGWDRPRLSLQSALDGAERGQDQSIPLGKLRPELPFG